MTYQVKYISESNRIIVGYVTADNQQGAEFEAKQLPLFKQLLSIRKWGYRDKEVSDGED